MSAVGSGIAQPTASLPGTSPHEYLELLAVALM
jgi:hypothetical protein